MCASKIACFNGTCTSPVSSGYEQFDTQSEPRRSWCVWHSSRVNGFRGTWDPQDQDVCNCLPNCLLHISLGQSVEVTRILSAEGAANPSVTPAPCLSTFDTLKLLGVNQHLAMQRKMKFVPLRSMATMPYRWNTSADWNLQRGSCTWRELQPGAWRQTRTSFCTMPCCRNGHAAMTCLNMRPRTIVHQHNLRVLQIGLPCFCRKDVKLLLSFIAYDFDARRAWLFLAWFL